MTLTRVSFKIQHALAFDAPRLQSITTAELLMRVTKSTVINGSGFANALELHIQESSQLGLHSSILHFHDAHVTRYTWAHKDIKPWGHRIPLQCPQCGVIQTWTTTASKDDNSEYKLECKNFAACGWDGARRVADPYSFKVVCPRDCIVLHSKRHTKTAWLKVELV